MRERTAPDNGGLIVLGGLAVLALAVYGAERRSSAPTGPADPEPAPPPRPQPPAPPRREIPPASPPRSGPPAEPRREPTPEPPRPRSPNEPRREPTTPPERPPGPRPAPSPPTTPPASPPKPAPSPQPVESDPAAREAEALARMLASESSNPKAQIIVGWITVQAARTWRMSVFRLLTGKSGQYGHQKHFLPDGSREIRYASTVRKPTDATLRLARGLLDGSVRPPEIIERTHPTSFVEMGKASKLVGPDGKPLQPETTPERILKLQSRYGGIVARLGSWFLYAKNAPPLTTIDQAAPI